MHIDLNQNNLTEQHAQIKKTWVTPNVEIISDDYIQSGSISKGPEGQFTSTFTIAKFHS
jgi:hypothetical protein